MVNIDVLASVGAPPLDTQLQGRDVLTRKRHAWQVIRETSNLRSEW